MEKEEARHLKVSRVHIGDEIKIFDGQGNKYIAKLSLLSDKTASGEILKNIPSTKNKLKLHLYFCAIARASAEDIIDKCTQAGVSTFVPVLSKFSEKDLLKKWQTKQDRWDLLALAACKQCETPYIPKIAEPLSFEEAVKSLDCPGIICYEDEEKTPLLEHLKTLKTEELALFIGPEGGFAPEEIALAKKHGIIPVTLGKNILRAETAACVACWAALQ